jgi:hypothetical protein
MRTTILDGDDDVVADGAGANDDDGANVPLLPYTRMVPRKPAEPDRAEPCEKTCGSLLRNQFTSK